MEVEQLIGVVRHLRAQKQAYDYMDEVLTAVVSANETIAKRTAELADIERQVQNKSASLTTLDAELTERKHRHEAELKEALATQLKEIHDSAVAAEAECMARAKELSDMDIQREDLTKVIAKLNAEVSATKKELELVQDQLESVRKTLTSIGTSIIKV